MACYTLIKHFFFHLFFFLINKHTRDFNNGCEWTSDLNKLNDLSFANQSIEITYKPIILAEPVICK